MGSWTITCTYNTCARPAPLHSAPHNLPTPIPETLGKALALAEGATISREGRDTQLRHYNDFAVLRQLWALQPSSAQRLGEALAGSGMCVDRDSSQLFAGLSNKFHESVC